MNQNQSAGPPQTPEIDKTKLAPGVQGAEQPTPKAQQPMPEQPAKDASASSPAKS